VLDSLSSTDVGRRVSAEEGAEREASEWELREQRELEEERRAEAGELGVGEELPLFLPTPSFSWNPQTMTGGGCDSFCSFLCLSLKSFFPAVMSLVFSSVWTSSLPL